MRSYAVSASGKVNSPLLLVTVPWLVLLICTDAWTTGSCVAASITLPVQWVCAKELVAVNAIKIPVTQFIKSFIVIKLAHTVACTGNKEPVNPTHTWLK